MRSFTIIPHCGLLQKHTKIWYSVIAPMKRNRTFPYVLFGLCLLAAFSLGIIHRSQDKHVIAATQMKKPDPISYCTGNNSCQKGSLSIFSKPKQTQVAGASDTHPNGFCLQVPVLLYHHVQPQSVAQQKGQTSLNVDNGIFDQQMGYLAAKGYQTISAEQLINALVAHTKLPANSVVITLDDAYLDNYIYAYPIFQKYHLTANLMIPTGLLGNTSGTNSYFSWDQLKEMVGSGIVFAYNHTWSHFAMGAGPREKDIFEITTAQQQLKDHLGKAYPLFVYPYGSGQTVGWVQNLVKQNGFLAAFSTLGGRFQCEGNIFVLPRIHVGNAPLSAYGI